MLLLKWSKIVWSKRSRYFLGTIQHILKKSLKIPKGQSESVIEEEHTTQWAKENVQKDKQRSTKHTYKTKDRVTRTPLKTGGELRCSGRTRSSCSSIGTRRVKPSNKSWMRKGPGSVYDKWNISVVIIQECYFE